MPLNPEILLDDEPEAEPVKLLPINGVLSKEETREASKDEISSTKFYRVLKYQIKPHPGFELITTPLGKTVKLAYGRMYQANYSNFEIELEAIRLLERKRGKVKEKETYARLYYHYKLAIAACNAKMARGWNRWSDDILKLFITNKIHKILWGSGNCGKSAVYGLLLYIKWRVNPGKRMVVLASKTLTDAKSRVFGYIKEFHGAAPRSPRHNIRIFDSKEKGIYVVTVDPETNKLIKNERGCIVSLPIKVNAKTNQIASEHGANLLGKHPDDQLILAFDEAQELLGSLIEQTIFLNWYTNQTIEIHAWGNPRPINFNAPSEWDLLFKLGGGHLSLATLKRIEKRSEKTDKWLTPDTAVLRLTALDSPKDDPDEVNAFVTEDGVRKHRLHFLAGSDTVETIRNKTTPNSPSWYSQVLGMPFIETHGSETRTVLTPYTVETSKKYPLFWRDSERGQTYYMGVDPTLTGNYDNCGIVIAKLGTMMDGRKGLDLENGLNCHQLRKTSEGEYTDYQIDFIHGQARKFKIPIDHIAIDISGIGEVMRYAILHKVEQDENYKDWKEQIANGKNFHYIDSHRQPTERLLFRTMRQMYPAKEFCNNIVMEYYQAVACIFMSRQIFNVPTYICQQFFNRRVFESANKTKFRLETKEELRKRMVPSPNDADALAYVIELIRVVAGFTFKIPKGDGYQAAFGIEYDRKITEAQVKQRLGIVSEILNLGLNFTKQRANYGGTSV